MLLHVAGANFGNAVLPSERVLHVADCVNAACIRAEYLCRAGLPSGVGIYSIGNYAMASQYFGKQGLCQIEHVVNAVQWRTLFGWAISWHNGC